MSWNKNTSTSYRDYDTYEYEELVNTVVKESDVKNLLDQIETDVNDIKDLLEPIKGLSDIDYILNKVNELSNKLY